MIKLQLALDFVKLEDAIRIADKAEKYVDFMEAGTPLIKSEGLKAVTALKERYPDKVVVADMKTMDTGFLEAEIAYQAGADIAAVLGAADRETIKGVVDAARKHKRLMMVDSIGMDDMEGLVKKVEGLGIDYLVLHTGIDQQNAGRSPFTDLENIQKLKLDARLALVGGLNAESLKRLSGYPRVDMVIIGGAITRVPDPEKAAADIRRVLDGIRQEDRA